MNVKEKLNQSIATTFLINMILSCFFGKEIIYVDVLPIDFKLHLTSLLKNISMYLTNLFDS